MVPVTPLCTLGQEHAMICPEGVSACRKLEDLVAVSPISRVAYFHSVKREREIV
jgi:hypothetical protein